MGLLITTALSSYRGNKKHLSRRVRRVGRLIGSLLVAILILLLPSLEVRAQTTTTGNAAKITAKPQSGSAGTIFSFSAQNFVPDETISTYVRWPEDYNFVEADVLFKVDDYGNASWTWDSTSVPPGNYTMVVVSQTNPERSASLVFTVLDNNNTGNSYQAKNYDFATVRLHTYQPTRLEGHPSR